MQGAAFGFHDLAPTEESFRNAVVAGLWDLGFTLDHAARSSRECLDLAHDEPAVLAGLLDRRFLWGGYPLFAALDVSSGSVIAEHHRRHRHQEFLSFLEND